MVVEFPSVLTDATATSIAIPDQVFALITGVRAGSFFGLVGSIGVLRLCHHIFTVKPPNAIVFGLSACRSADLSRSVKRSHGLINAIGEGSALTIWKLYIPIFGLVWIQEPPVVGTWTVHCAMASSMKQVLRRAERFVPDGIIGWLRASKLQKYQRRNKDAYENKYFIVFKKSAHIGAKPQFAFLIRVQPFHIVSPRNECL
jgi:hypothetical protein